MPREEDENIIKSPASETILKALGVRHWQNNNSSICGTCCNYRVFTSSGFSSTMKPERDSSFSSPTDAEHSIPFHYQLLINQHLDCFKSLAVLNKWYTFCLNSNIL